MADFWTIMKLDRIASGDCPLYNSNGIIGPLAIAIDFYPYYITMAIWGITMFQYELFTLILSITLTLDFVANFLFSFATTYGYYPSCGSSHEMPSFATQHIFVFTIIIISLINKWELDISPFKLLFIQTFHFLVIASRIYIGINTIPQLFVGAFIGLAEGLIFQYTIDYIFTHKIWFLETRIFKFVGIKDEISKKSFLWVQKDFKRPT